MRRLGHGFLAALVALPMAVLMVVAMPGRADASGFSSFVNWAGEHIPGVPDGLAEKFGLTDPNKQYQEKCPGSDEDFFMGASDPASAAIGVVTDAGIRCRFGQTGKEMWDSARDMIRLNQRLPLAVGTAAGTSIYRAVRDMIVPSPGVAKPEVDNARRMVTFSAIGGWQVRGVWSSNTIMPISTAACIWYAPKSWKWTSADYYSTSTLTPQVCQTSATVQTPATKVSDRKMVSRCYYQDGSSSAAAYGLSDNSTPTTWGGSGGLASSTRVFTTGPAVARSTLYPGTDAQGFYSETPLTSCVWQLPLDDGSTATWKFEVTSAVQVPRELQASVNCLVTDPTTGKTTTVTKTVSYYPQDPTVRIPELTCDPPPSGQSVVVNNYNNHVTNVNNNGNNYYNKNYPNLPMLPNLGDITRLLGTATDALGQIKQIPLDLAKLGEQAATDAGKEILKCIASGDCVPDFHKPDGSPVDPNEITDVGTDPQGNPVDCSFAGQQLSHWECFDKDTCDKYSADQLSGTAYFAYVQLCEKDDKDPWQQPVEPPAKPTNYVCDGEWEYLNNSNTFVCNGHPTKDPDAPADPDDPTPGTDITLWSGVTCVPLGADNAVVPATFNPIQWVLLPTECALDWAFMPTDVSVNPPLLKIENSWAGTPLAQAGGLFDQIGDIRSAWALGPSECASLPIRIPGIHVAGAVDYEGTTIYPFSYCDEPMKSVQKYAHVFTGGVFWLAGIGTGLAIVCSTFGLKMPWRVS